MKVLSACQDESALAKYIVRMEEEEILQIALKKFQIKPRVYFAQALKSKKFKSA